LGFIAVVLTVSIVASLRSEPKVPDGTEPSSADPPVQEH
jgi:hypothetical protein